MPRSAFTDAHKIVVKKLTEARKKAGIRQADLAVMLNKDQSFVSNIERGQRRVDMIEFYVICNAIDVDPAELYRTIVNNLPDIVDI